MLSPDQLPAAIAPPASTDPHTAAAQLRLADTAMALVEQLLAAVPEGRHLQASLVHLVRAAQAAYTGMQPALVPEDADASIPHTLTTPRPPAPAPMTAEVWRWGVQTSPALHPLSRLVGLILADCAQPSGRIAPSSQPTLRQLSTRTGLGMQGLHHHLTDLVDRGWVTRERTTQGSTTTTKYQLRLPDSPKEH